MDTIIMNKTNQQFREIFKKLPEKIRLIILSPELSSSNNSLNQNVRELFSKTLVNILAKIEPQEALRESLIGAGLEKNVVEKIEHQVESTILSKIDEIYTEIESNIEKDSGGERESESGQVNNKENKSDTEARSTTYGPAKPEQPRSRMAPVGFEEAILNQAKAMRPAIPPENLPTQNAEPHKIHNYTSGADPYREPTE